MDTSLSFTSFETVILVGSVILLLAFIALFYKIYINRIAQKGLTEKYTEGTSNLLYENRNKYPEVDVLRKTDSFFFTGLIFSLLLTVLLFGWTTYEEKIIISDYSDIPDEEIVVEPPRTKEPPPLPPPPLPPQIQEVPEEMITEDEEFEFVDQSLEVDTEVYAPPTPEKKPQKTFLPPPPPPEPEVEEIFKIVEDMPRFPGCEDLNEGKVAKTDCANKKLYAFIYEHIKYPAIARENGVDGMVVIRFVIEKDGLVNGAEIVRDIGAGCGDEALRVVKMMNEMPQKWIPGKQRGKPVRVMFNLPVRFKLATT